ncbi:carboxylesterase/lipase family protein [Spongiactinospora sp. TRM90649]|uniref:carboxylesterase/lipase family protein n=1 Tax=Spongiactinospora sp. TRM90649 TaxID=3031114 RepID=UPI0023F9EB4A|nr:carboxylesterase/lipase family protein [Spongiactinospora sp. TRM90649]MDF5752832.1 carboxylesterase family protein [Spongiactinospora sp. TRM90649]
MMIRSRAAVAAGLGLSLALTTGVASATADRGALVTTDGGRLQGVVADDHRSFSGIPYAAPPVGELRWASPRPAVPWAGRRDATRPGPACAQTAGMLGEKRSLSEDCLYLNVTTPRRASARPRPVIVWLHGGGFRNGSGDMYGADRLAVRGDAVVVTVNYRLGVFGYLAHPALDGGNAENLSGNFGIEDQRAALRWVRRNAASFGGDPGNVTVAGESAGGASACAHLISPGSAGLFQRAIVQSAPCTMARWPAGWSWLPRPRAQAYRHGEATAERLGCPAASPAAVAACLRAKSPAELLAHSQNEFAPVIGGPLLPRDPATAFAAGRFNRVPVMHGITRDEHVTFGQELAGAPPLTDDGYVRGIRAYFGDQAADRVLARYPLDNYGEPGTSRAGAAMQSVMTDHLWATPAVETNRLLAAKVPTYAYEFADRGAPWVSGTPVVPSFPTGAFHASELQYLFAADYFAGRTLSPAQARLSDTMIAYWSRFARTGDPNGPGTPYWPAVDAGEPAVQRLAPGPSGIRRTDLCREHRCRFWNSF